VTRGTSDGSQATISPYAEKIMIAPAARMITAMTRKIRTGCFWYHSSIRLIFSGPSTNIKRPPIMKRSPKANMSQGYLHSRAPAKKTMARANLITPEKYMRLPCLKNSISHLIMSGLSKYTIPIIQKTIPKLLITMSIILSFILDSRQKTFSNGCPSDTVIFNSCLFNYVGLVEVSAVKDNGFF
jgi:hypothetical protein